MTGYVKFEGFIFVHCILVAKFNFEEFNFHRSDVL